MATAALARYSQWSLRKTTYGTYLTVPEGTVPHPRSGCGVCRGGATEIDPVQCRSHWFSDYRHLINVWVLP